MIKKADRMSTAVPSGAVSGATPSGGVVQGIFISEYMNNGRVPKEDVEAAIKTWGYLILHSATMRSVMRF